MVQISFQKKALLVVSFGARTRDRDPFEQAPSNSRIERLCEGRAVFYTDVS
jgi:hypothetical protein